MSLWILIFPEKKILKIKYKALICFFVVVHSGEVEGEEEVRFSLLLLFWFF